MAIVRETEMDWTLSVMVAATGEHHNYILTKNGMNSGIEKIQFRYWKKWTYEKRITLYWRSQERKIMNSFLIPALLKEQKHASSI